MLSHTTEKFVLKGTYRDNDLNKSNIKSISAKETNNITEKDRKWAGITSCRLTTILQSFGENWCFHLVVKNRQELK